MMKITITLITLFALTATLSGNTDEFREKEIESTKPFNDRSI